MGIIFQYWSDVAYFLQLQFLGLQTDYFYSTIDYFQSVNKICSARHSIPFLRGRGRSRKGTGGRARSKRESAIGGDTPATQANAKVRVYRVLDAIIGKWRTGEAIALLLLFLEQIILFYRCLNPSRRSKFAPKI